MIEHLHGQKPDEDPLEKQVKRQRMLMIFCGMIVLGGLMLSVFSCQENKESANKVSAEANDKTASVKTGEATSKTKSESKTGEADQPATTNKEADKAKPETWPKVDEDLRKTALADESFKKDHYQRFAGFVGKTYPEPKPTQTTTEGVAVVSYPWRAWRRARSLSGDHGNRPALLKTLKSRKYTKEEYLNMEWEWRIPKEKAWLPEIDREINYALCDNNSRLEAAFSRRVEEVLPRIGAEINWEGIADVAKALSVKHVIVINWGVQFQTTKIGSIVQGGAGWQLWSYSYGQQINPNLVPEIRPWPKQDALKRLADDIRGEMGAFTGVPTTASSMPQRDEYGVRLAALKRLLLEHRYYDAQTALTKLLKDYPKDPTATYSVYEYTKGLQRDRLRAEDAQARKELHDLVVEMIYAYAAQGGKDLRLRTLAAANLAYNPGSEDLAAALRIARPMLRGVLYEDPLFLEAYNQLRTMPTIDLKGEISEVGAVNYMEKMVKLFPNEARYHIGLGALLALNPDHAEDALKKAKKALLLAPWMRGAYYTCAQAELNIAHKKQRLKQASVKEIEGHFLRAYQAALEGWKRDRADFRYYFPMMARALAYGKESQGQGGYGPKVPGKNSHLMPLYAACSVQNVVYPTQLDATYTSFIFATQMNNKRLKYYDKYLRLWTDKIIETGDYNPPVTAPLGKTDNELVVLAGLIQAVKDLAADPDDAALKARSRKILKYYRALGARAAFIESLLGVGR